MLTDCLIENTCDTPINIIKIIYPNRLFKIKKRLKNKGKPKERRAYSKVYFDNEVKTFENPNLEQNQIYNAFGSETTDSTEPFKSWGFDLPNPGDAENPIKIRGNIDTNYRDTLCLEPDFTNMISGLLYDINYTVLNYGFDRAIKPGEARWLRLKFRGEQAAKVSFYTKYILLRRFTNSLSYLYQICGPNEVKKDFIKRVKIGSQQLDNSSIGFKTLIKFFENEGVIETAHHTPSTTLFSNISINVEPRGVDIEHVHFINKDEGKAIREGEFPDVIISGQRYRDFYRWKITNDDPFSFRFRGRPLNLTYLLVPIVGLSLAAIGGIFGIYKIMDFILAKFF